MAAGDVTVQLVNAVEADIDTALTALRVTANDKFLLCSVGRESNQILIAHIEEA